MTLHPKISIRQLKRDARALCRQHSDLKWTDALDQIARREGHASWDAFISAPLLPKAMPAACAPGVATGVGPAVSLHDLGYTRATAVDTLTRMAMDRLRGELAAGGGGWAASMLFEGHWGYRNYEDDELAFELLDMGAPVLNPLARGRERHCFPVGGTLNGKAYAVNIAWLSEAEIEAGGGHRVNRGRLPRELSPALVAKYLVAAALADFRQSRYGAAAIDSYKEPRWGTARMNVLKLLFLLDGFENRKRWLPVLKANGIALLNVTERQGEEPVSGGTNDWRAEDDLLGEDFLERVAELMHREGAPSA